MLLLLSTSQIVLALRAIKPQLLVALDTLIATGDRATAKF